MKRHVSVGLVATALELISGVASAEVLLDVEPYFAATTGSYDRALQLVEYQVALALAGGARWTVVVRTEDGDILVEEGLEGSPDDEVQVVVESETWGRWAPGIKRHVLEELGYRLGMIVTAYEVRVAKACNPHLGDEPILAELEIDPSFLPGWFDAKYLLTSFVVENAGQCTSIYGPNCWHASIAAVNEGFEELRFMSEGEFARHLASRFQPVDEPEQLGDLIRLRDEDGNDVHAFTYVGRDWAKPEHRIVFTKNGKMPGAYLFMDYESVLALYPGSEASYYRRVRAGQGWSQTAKTS